MKVLLSTVTKEELFVVKEWENFQWLLLLLRHLKNWKEDSGNDVGVTL